tara:strand:+ start:254 stop:628 length:375 start_codon:yes stop_codon:yes gene_type:complete
LKNLLILILFLVAGYQAWDRFAPKTSVAPLEARSYIAVYGRDTCGWTQRALQVFERNGVNYRYFIVDDRQVAERLHSRMQAAGLSTGRYQLPVIDVNGEMMVRPDPERVLGRYRDRLYQQAGYR